MLEQVQNIFIIGIKGVGMANLALILKKMGKNVSGVDVEEEFITDKWLKKSNIPITVGFNDFPKETELVVYSAAHGGNQNSLVLKAQKDKVQVVHQAQFINELMKQFKVTIAVTGSHGKTTTASMLAYALIKLGVKPSYLVGSSDFNGYPAGDFASSNYFVVEADEYAVDPPKDKTPKFKFLHPNIILCTNIDFDHPDVFSDLEDIKKAFVAFFKQAKKVIRADKVKIENISAGLNGVSFTLEPYGQFDLSLYGDKNASNAAGVILTLIELGFKAEEIKTAIKGFAGAKRRFEQKFSHKGTYLFDDYAHHPEEIKSTIQAARKKFPGKRIIVVFQPHTYSRTQALLKDFSHALTLADTTFVLPIFSSARENPSDFKVTSNDIIEKANSEKIKAINSTNSLLTELKKSIQSGDVVFTMGAGDVYKLGDDIIELIRKV